VRLLALVPVALALLLPGSAEAARHCQPKGAKVVRASGSVRVYKLHSRVYACRGRAGKRYLLGDIESYGGFGGWYVSPIRIRGPLVGFARQSYDHYGSTDATVLVKDLRDGTVLHSFSASGGMHACDGEGPPYTVTDLALAPSGAVAWIARVDNCEGTRQEVVTLVDGPDPTVLDDDAAIGAESLRYQNGSIFWSHGGWPGPNGAERSAPLP
jgi:hypothetical protein